MKRRDAIGGLVGVVVAAPAAPAAAIGNTPRIDKRLIGTWRSDKARTNKHWRYGDGVSPETKAAIDDFFGKLSLTYDETEIHSDYEGFRETTPYAVVASDTTSVVIAVGGGAEPVLRQLHFEEGAYYQLEGRNYNFEFFRRVDA